MLFAHERPKLADWEESGEEYKTIGMLKIKKYWIQEEDGSWTVDHSDVTYVYPSEDDELKIAQWWQLAWAGVQPSGYDFEDFFGQLDPSLAEKALKGITLDEDEDGTPLWNYPEIVVGFRPLAADTKFLGAQANWWRM